MKRYMIETPHDQDGCNLLLEEVSAMGFLHNFDWGCSVGVHIGWAIIEAESEEQALMAVPSLARDRARVVRLIKYTPEMVRELHAG